MAEQKTLPTDADVYEFLESATPAKRREDALEVDALMREVTGVEPVLWGPSIVGYGSFRYISAKNPRTRGIWPPVAFSPRKASLTFYGLGDMPGAEELLAQLGTCTRGAGCVYVKKLEDIDLDVLRQLVALAFSRGDDPEPA